jgi:hypothetical protein
MLAYVGLLLCPPTVLGKESGFQSAVVTEAFLEIHTGPASSYPVHYVAERGETILLMRRRVDWYQIRLGNGTEGWAHRRDIEQTLLASGYRKGWLDQIYDDWIAGKTALGWSAGTFAGDPALFVHLVYTFTDRLAAEANASFSSGDFGSTQLYDGGLVITPWQGRSMAVTGTLGGGAAHVAPTSLLVNAESGTFPTMYAGLGISIPLFRNLEARADVRHVTLFMSPERTRNFQAYSVGLSFRF